MSDVVLAGQPATQHVGIGGDAVPITPLGVVHADSMVSLYYQAYGLTPGAAYRSQIEIRRRFSDDEKDRISVAFEDRPNAATAMYRRTISLRQLRPGAYRVNVAMTSRNGSVVERTRDLNVVE